MSKIKALFVVVGIVAIAGSGCRKDKESQPTPAGQEAAANAEAPAKAVDGEAAASAEERLTGPVARVNGEAIPSEEFYKELDKITQGGTRNIPDDRLGKIEQNILKRLIEEELLRQEIAKQGIEVTEEELQEQFDKYKARFKGDEQFQSYLKHGKTTVERIRERLGSSFALTKLLEKMGQLEVTEEDIEKAYKTGIRMYTEPEQAHAAHILVKVSEKAPEDKVAKAREKVEEALKRIEEGADFGEVAKEISEDAMTKGKGGDLGFFRRGVMVPKFEEAAFALEPGEMTKEPVRTPFGFHIIKVMEKKKERVSPLEEVREKISQSLRNRAMFKARRELIDRIRSEAKIEILLED